MLVSGGWAALRGRSAFVALLLAALVLMAAAAGYTEEILVQGIDGAALVGGLPAAAISCAITSLTRAA